MSKLTVALISPVCRIRQPEANRKHFGMWIEKAAESGAELICFPELALSGYGPDPAIKEVAERMDRTPAAVSKLLMRAVDQLRESFGDTESLFLPERVPPESVPPEPVSPEPVSPETAAESENGDGER